MDWLLQYSSANTAGWYFIPSHSFHFAFVIWLSGKTLGNWLFSLCYILKWEEKGISFYLSVQNKEANLTDSLYMGEDCQLLPSIL